MKINDNLSKDALRKIRQITIATRRVLNGMLVGDTRTATKGSGFDFDQIRTYTPGDDIRFIDWKASARTDSMVVKNYVEERNRTVHVLVDISGSSSFTTDTSSKRDIAAQVASIIALSSFYGKDNIGLTLFSDEVAFFLPPSGTLAHVTLCIEKLFCFPAKTVKTNITNAIDRILQVEKRKSLVFLISDFIDDYCDEKKLAILAKKHAVIAVRCLDNKEMQLPSVGLVHCSDIETGQKCIINTSDQKAIQDFFNTRLKLQNKLFAKYAIDVLNIATDEPVIVDKVVRFFKHRMRY